MCFTSYFYYTQSIQKIKHHCTWLRIFWHERGMLLNSSVILPLGSSDAMEYAAAYLRKNGFYVADMPGIEITHLLLPAPAWEAPGIIKGGTVLASILEQLPKTVTVIGGNLDVPGLDSYQNVDLLKDPDYLAKNAAITAHCALRLVLPMLPCTMEALPILVIGWGRIGKCLAQLLRNVGARVTVAARKQEDRAMLRALGYEAVDFPIDPKPYRVIFNTAPCPVLDAQPCNALKIDLASVKGMAGTDVIHARGLPGKDAPESSGQLIAKTVIHYITGKEDQS